MMPAPRENRFRIRVRIGDGDAARVLEIDGRDAWALHVLIKAGEQVCTPIDTPGPRWSGYVHKLRKQGILIETVHETHGGTFPGCHARYVLRSPIRVLEVFDPKAPAANVVPLPVEARA